MPKIEFNLNGFVYIKITEVGFKHLRDSYIELCGSSKMYIPPSVDKDGYCKMQAHEFINNFGNKWWGACHPKEMPFDTNILINIEP